MLRDKIDRGLGRGAEWRNGERNRRGSEDSTVGGGRVGGCKLHGVVQKTGVVATC